MKEFILGAIRKIANVLLVVSIISAVSGLALTFIPELVETIGLELSQEQLGYFTGMLGMAASAGGMAKYASTALKKVTELNKSDMEIKLKRQSELHNAELDAIKEQNTIQLELFTTVVNEVIDEVKASRVEQQKVLEVLAITAKRNITTKLVSKEDKELYRKFLSNIEDGKESNLKNVYTEIKNTIEKVEEEKEENQAEDLIKARLEEI